MPLGLRHAVFGVMPFALVALVQFYRSTTLLKPDRKASPVAGLPKAARAGPEPFDGEPSVGWRAEPLRKANLRVGGGPAAATVASAASTPTTPAAEPTQAAAVATQARQLSHGGSATTEAAAPLVVDAPTPDVSRNYPAPTLSAKKLLDGTSNWLPVPNAEGPDPDDLAWMKRVQPNATSCPPGRRPYHTILTAQRSLYQEWQTRIFYHHFRRAQREAGPCTEMTGFTRLLAGNAPDALMDLMPTVRLPELGADKTRGFQVINRPWTLSELVKQPAFATRIQEEYVYIAETDHLLLKAPPNRATPQLNVAFFFPYMSPVPSQQASVVKRYYQGNHLDVQPVGGSPAIMHTATLKKLAPVWFDLSVKLKADRDADRIFGWVLEMWGYSIACAQLGIKQFVWQKLQIEPSAAWHQEVSAQDPYIYHYTFGVEYTLEGVPVVGGVGEWSLDKRKYFGRAPPRRLSQPPECAQECAWRWWRLFNEATDALHAQGQWYDSTGADTLRKQHTPRQLSPLAKALVQRGPWRFASGDELHFFRRDLAYSRWGGGSWTQTGDTTVKLSLCSPLVLTFDHATQPTSFTYKTQQGAAATGTLARRDAWAEQPDWAHAESVTVKRLLGEGPWLWNNKQPLAFLWGGVLASPMGAGSYEPIEGSKDVQLTLNGETHRLTMTGCYTFSAVKQGAAAAAASKGWIPVRHVSMEYTGWRDAGGCRY